MTRFLPLMLVVALLAPLTLSAQRHGGGMGRSGGSGPSGAGSSTDSEMANDLKHVMAAQANADQATEFRQLVKSTAAVRQQLQELEKQAPKPGDSAISIRTAALQTVLDERKNGEDRFLNRLSASQSTELKKPLKNLRNSSTRVGTDWTALRRELEHTGPDGSNASKAAEKLDNEFSLLQAHQGELGAEMGIQ